MVKHHHRRHHQKFWSAKLNTTIKNPLYTSSGFQEKSTVQSDPIATLGLRITAQLAFPPSAGCTSISVVHDFRFFSLTFTDVFSDYPLWNPIKMILSIRTSFIVSKYSCVFLPLWIFVDQLPALLAELELTMNICACRVIEAFFVIEIKRSFSISMIIQHHHQREQISTHETQAASRTIAARNDVASLH